MEAGSEGVANASTRATERHGGKCDARCGDTSACSKGIPRASAGILAAVDPLPRHKTKIAQPEQKWWLNKSAAPGTRRPNALVSFFRDLR